MVAVAAALIVNWIAGALAGPPPAPRIGWKYRLTAEEARRDRTLLLTAEERAATFAFSSRVTAAERDLFLRAVAAITPDARRVLDLVDGVVEVEFGEDADGALGRAFYEADGRHHILLDLARIRAHVGLDAVREVALHELGHIVGTVFLPEDVQRSLDAQIPPGYPCPVGTRVSSCAPRTERFADTFAKWATGGELTYRMRGGYAVLPPTTGLEAWGAPLVALGRR